MRLPNLWHLFITFNLLIYYLYVHDLMPSEEFLFNGDNTVQYTL